MSRSHLFCALIGLSLAGVQAQGQGVRVGVSAYGVNYARVTPRGAVAFSAGGYREFYYAPSYGYGRPYYFGPGFFGPPAQVTVFYSPPPRSSPIIIAIPVVREREREPREDPPEVRRRVVEPPPPEPPLPGRDAGVFRPLEADNRARAEKAPKIVAPVPRPAEAQNPPAPRGKPVMPARVETLFEKGENAFLDGEYGRAAEFFDRAALETPWDVLPLYHLGQAYFALGKYAEAVDILTKVMVLRPTYAVLKLPLRKLYGPNEEEYLEQLRDLEEAVRRYPDDPNLLFLLGHQYWFDGRPEEAKALFQRARPRFRDVEKIDRFMKAGAGGVTALNGQW